MWIKLTQLILGLSILIVLHELGHFIPAKIFKTRVEKFFLFFDWKFALFKKKIGDTVYGIGWLPLGGYVKISGMVDESMDTEALNEPPQPWEFRAKPAWQRLIILTGGVLVNFILGYLIYVFVLFHYGEMYLPNDALTYGIWTNEAGKEIGLQNGDKIISVNGKVPDNFREAALEITLGQDGFIEVDRAGQVERIAITEAGITKLVETRGYADLIVPRMPYVVGGFSEGSAAEKAGLQINDSLIALNGHQMLFFDQYKDSIPRYAGQDITLTAMRAGNTVDIMLSVPQDSVIGIGLVQNLDRFYTLKTKEFTFGEAMSGAVKSTWDKLSSYVRQFKLIFNFNTGAYKEVGGFYTILQQYSDTWDWQRFWEFTAFLSLMLGFLNILPIPALDGGHVVFTLYEMVTGRKPSTKVLEYAQMVGFFLLLALLVFANGQDILRAIGKG
jgi:regulator of sigma E protease